ncbi:hypothetical protein G6011_09548 [Alternaria panax]|uniref:Uncharacterized protein n=1 Tax=Alternaria panax TaxID=48097 RepID=A0AAD4FBL7_9PLEO|nr:hypothetical protein G6011_09548 [Alternaria panax]
MLSKTSLALVALHATLARAGNAIITNRCNYDIWIQSVHAPYGGNMTHVPARSKYSEPFSHAPTSVKISKTPSIVSGEQTQFEYNIVSNQLWYDISFVDCAKGPQGASGSFDASSCPGHNEGLAMDVTNNICGKISCDPGAYCPTQAYFVPQPYKELGIEEPVFVCPGDGTSFDLHMTVCSGEPRLRCRGIARSPDNAQTASEEEE